MKLPFRKPPQRHVFHPQHASKKAFLGDLPSVEPYIVWVEHWCDALTACWHQGGTIIPLEIAPPASESDLADIEAHLAHPIPSRLRHMVTTFSRHLQFGWDWPNPWDLAEFHFPRVHGGMRLGLSLQALPGLQDCLFCRNTCRVNSCLWRRFAPRVTLRRPLLSPSSRPVDGGRPMAPWDSPSLLPLWPPHPRNRAPHCGLRSGPDR